MAAVDTEALFSLIDKAVHTNGPLGKTTAPGLNAVLRRITEDLAEAIPAAASVPIEQSLASGSTSAVPSIQATAAAIGAVPVPTGLRVDTSDDSLYLELTGGNRIGLELDNLRNLLPFTSATDLSSAPGTALTIADTVRGSLAKLQQQLTNLAPADTTSAKMLVVQGYQQTVPGVRGRFDRPFANPVDAVNAAQDGDTILLLSGGDGIDALGRPVYSEEVHINKSLNFVFLGAICSGYWIFGPYPGALYDMRISVRNGYWTGGIAIIASNGFNHRYNFDDCRFEGESAVFELVPDGFAQALNSPGLDVHEYRNCVWNMTYSDTTGCFILQNRTDSGATQHRRIILDNCRLATANTPIFVKWWNPGDSVILRGTTQLLPGGGQPLQTLSSPNSTPSYTDAEVITDERPSGNAGGTSGKLYDGLGQNTDGALTQKAVTEALANKIDQLVITARRSWYVEDLGQADAGAGSPINPFKSFAAAHAVAQDGDTIFYAPAGTYNSATTRYERQERLDITKSITVVVTTPTVLTDWLQVGTYPASSAAINVRVVGLHTASRVVLIMQQGQVGSTLTLDECQLAAGGFVEHYGYVNSAGPDRIMLKNLLADTRGSNQALLFFNEHGAMADACSIYLNGGTLRPGGNLLGEATAYGPQGDSRVFIGANTDIQLVPGAVLTHIDRVVDNRPTGTGGGGTYVRPAVTQAIHDAVVAGDFTTTPGVLTGSAPAGSLLDMKFSEGGWAYSYFERGSSLTPTWHRLPLA